MKGNFKMKRLILTLSVLIFVLTGCADNNNENQITSNEFNVAKLSTEIEANEQAKSEEISKTNEQPKQEEEIGKYSTKIYDKSSDRQNNLEITCSKLNGYIVKSGQTFSFEDTIGQAKKEEGYKKAKIFDSDGNVKEGYGGGKCQVSTTLFNAVRNIPGITVTERHNHSSKVPYAKAGDDAAVAHGGYDFHYINNNDYDIKINASVDKKNIVITINKIQNNLHS